MSAKQDRSAARTVEDIERRYNFEQRFSEVMGVATDARLAAEKAQYSVDGLTQEQIFNILTNNGEEQGIYREDGKLYINASYIKGGIIISEGQAYLRPTYDDCVAMLRSVVFPEDYPVKDFYDLNGDGTFDINDFRLAVDVYYGSADISQCVSLEKSAVTVTIEPDNPFETVKVCGTNMWGSEVVVSLGINSTKIPVIDGGCSVGGILTVEESAVIPSLSLSVGETPKSLSWKDNGDGTYTLIGT